MFGRKHRRWLIVGGGEQGAVTNRNGELLISTNNHYKGEEGPDVEVYIDGGPPKEQQSDAFFVVAREDRCHGAGWLHEANTVWIRHPKERTGKGISEDMASEWWLMAGMLYSHTSSVMVGLHIAVICGAESIVIDGCQGWDDKATRPRQKRLRESKELLDQFYAMWHDKIELRNASPASLVKWPAM